MFTIKIADFNICIANNYPYIEQQCKNYITNSKDYIFKVSATKEDLQAEANNSDFECYDGYLESIAIYRKICQKLPEYNAFLLHSSVIKVAGNAFALCGKSRTGKSTHTRLLQQLLKDKLTIINGDKPIIRYINGKFFAYGTPWSGKEKWNTNDNAPLKAIFLLQQYKTNSVEKITPQQAVKPIMSQVLLPKKEKGVIKILEMLDKMLNDIDIYILKCNISNEAALTSYKIIKEINENED